MLKIMLVNDAGNRLGRLRRALEDAGIELVAERSMPACVCRNTSRRCNPMRC